MDYPNMQIMISSEFSVDVGLGVRSRALLNSLSLPACFNCGLCCMPGADMDSEVIVSCGLLNSDNLTP
jgi:hypothetical protein